MFADFLMFAKSANIGTTGKFVSGARSADTARPPGGDQAQKGSEDGTVEIIEDEWRDPASAHRVLDRPWRGKTEFELSTGVWKLC